MTLYFYGAKPAERRKEMTEQTMKELIKSFAYGETPVSLAEMGAVEKEEAEKFQSEHVAEIEAKKAELKEAGWM